MQPIAIWYQRDGYCSSGERLLGRQVAGEGFLKALLRYGSINRVYCYAPQRSDFLDCCQQIRSWKTPPRQLTWVPFVDSSRLAEATVLYRPDPQLSQSAWTRRYHDPSAYSLCGVTHTLASKEAMAAIGELLIAPVQPWDALVCTSQAVKTMIECLLGTWADYLTERMGSRPSSMLQLPIIPLGVDCAALASTLPQTHLQLRQNLGIAPEDLVILYVGRLVFHAKAHPMPMYLAVERAAQATATKVHLIQAGWFEDKQQEQAFQQVAAQISPTVNCLVVDGRQAEIRREIWLIADVFVSLSDNVQETFGLTPIEAMAAGLPVVVSDWNGYQETVRHEVDGFRIPTLIPPAGSGLELARDYYNDELGYSNYLGHCSLSTAIDIDAAAEALTQLLTQPALRKRMGQCGQQRAQTYYDWSVVVASYEALWQELQERRSHFQQLAPLPAGMPVHPLCDDPYRLLTHYATESLQSNHRLQLGQFATPAGLQLLQNWQITHFGASRRVPIAIVEQILTAIQQSSSLTVADLVEQYAASEATQAELYRSLVYLIKFDVLRLMKA